MKRLDGNVGNLELLQIQKWERLVGRQVIPTAPFEMEPLDTTARQRLKEAEIHKTRIQVHSDQRIGYVEMMQMYRGDVYDGEARRVRE